MFISSWSRQKCGVHLQKCDERLSLSLSLFEAMSLLEDEPSLPSEEGFADLDAGLGDSPTLDGGGLRSRYQSTTGRIPRAPGNRCTEPVLAVYDRGRNWYDVLSEVMGKKFLWGLACAQFVIKGFLAGGGTGGYVLLCARMDVCVSVITGYGNRSFYCAPHNNLNHTGSSARPCPFYFGTWELTQCACRRSRLWRSLPGPSNH